MIDGQVMEPATYSKRVWRLLHFSGSSFQQLGSQRGRNNAVVASPGQKQARVLGFGFGSGLARGTGDGVCTRRNPRAKGSQDQCQDVGIVSCCSLT